MKRYKRVLLKRYIREKYGNADRDRRMDKGLEVTKIINVFSNALIDS